MNGHRSQECQDDSAHGAGSMREPLLQPEGGNPKKGTAGDAHPRHCITRQWCRVTNYFANHPPTVGYMLFLSLVFGVSSGVVAFVYDTYFEAILKLVWEVRLLSRLFLGEEKRASAMRPKHRQRSPRRVLKHSSEVILALQMIALLNLIDETDQLVYAI